MARVARKIYQVSEAILSADSWISDTCQNFLGHLIDFRRTCDRFPDGIQGGVSDLVCR